MGCDHTQLRSIGSSTLRNDGRKNIGTQAYEKTAAIAVPYRDTCGKCGARRIDQQIGMEERPEAYVARLVEVFREVKRVLRDDGVLFLNLGDSYAGSGGAGGDYSQGGLKQGQPPYKSRFRLGNDMGSLKPKDLIGIPWAVAFALRADGWWLRSEIIWHKLAPMPESVTDRPTKAHEQVFLLAKSERYYFDNIAIAEQGKPEGSHARGNGFGKLISSPYGKQSTGTLETSPYGRNKRSVWTLGPEPYSGAHFATFPTKLVEPMVLAGTSAKGCCAKCGAPWERVVERERIERTNGGASPSRAALPRPGRGDVMYPTSGLVNNTLPVTTTTGWAATCTCVESPEQLYWCPDCDIRADISELTQGCPNCGETMIPAPFLPVPCTVLDCFSGAATVGVVALRHGRNYIGIDLNAEYLEMSRKRLGQVQPMLFEVTP